MYLELCGYVRSGQNHHQVPNAQICCIPGATGPEQNHGDLTEHTKIFIFVVRSGSLLNPGLYERLLRLLLGSKMTATVVLLRNQLAGLSEGSRRKELMQQQKLP